MIRRYVIADDEEQALELVTEGYPIYSRLKDARKDLRSGKPLELNFEHPQIFRVLIEHHGVEPSR